MADSKCLTDIPVEKLVAGIFVRENGKTYLLADLTLLREPVSALSCTSETDYKQLIKEAITVNESGQLVLNIGYIAPEMP